jgi:hypothetical protein
MKDKICPYCRAVYIPETHKMCTVCFAAGINEEKEISEMMDETDSKEWDDDDDA